METQTETELPDYKTRTIHPDEIDVLFLVLDESIKAGKKDEFYYSSMNDVNHLAIHRIGSVSNKIEDKKILFRQVDQRSYTYTRILQIAKIALRKLQDDGDYNYYSAELISRFLQLEEIFGEKKLKSVGVKWIQEQEKKLQEKTPDTYSPAIELDEEGDEVYIPQEMTGKKLKRYKKKLEEQSEIGESLKGLDFTDETETLKSLDFK